MNVSVIRYLSNRIFKFLKIIIVIGIRYLSNRLFKLWKLINICGISYLSQRIFKFFRIIIVRGTRNLSKLKGYFILYEFNITANQVHNVAVRCSFFKWLCRNTVSWNTPSFSSLDLTCFNNATDSGFSVNKPEINVRSASSIRDQMLQLLKASQLSLSLASSIRATLVIPMFFCNVFSISLICGN